MVGVQSAELRRADGDPRRPRRPRVPVLLEEELTSFALLVAREMPVALHASPLAFESLTSSASLLSALFRSSSIFAAPLTSPVPLTFPPAAAASIAASSIVVESRPTTVCGCSAPLIPRLHSLVRR